VLRLAAEGLGNREIGQQLRTTAGAAKMHLQSIFSKLGVADRRKLEEFRNGIEENFRCALLTERPGDEFRRSSGRSD
jgi:hypothetical protein